MSKMYTQWEFKFSVPVSALCDTAFTFACNKPVIAAAVSASIA